MREFGRKVSVVIIQHAGGSRTPAHWDAPRGFARQRGGPDIESLSKTFPKSLKSIPKIPRTLQKRPRIDPKGLLDPILDLYLKKDGFRASKKQSKSAEKTAQTVPTPSQMEPKTLPNPLFKAFCNLFCHSKFTSLLHGLFLDFL